MKKSIKKNVLFFLLFIAFTINFISCSDDNTAYKKEIETADAFFKRQQYNEAKTYYLKAVKLNKNEAYPTNQITKINIILNKIKEKEVKPQVDVAETKILKETNIKVDKPYVVVIASYEIASNAKAHQKKLNSKGYNTTIVKSDAGNHLISLQTFKTITASYNYLESLDTSDDYDINEAWVYKIK